MHTPERGFGRLLERLSRIFAVAGGLVLLAMILMSMASVVGRWLFSLPIQGDYELIQLGCAVCVAAFLPICQMQRSNIIVDFFTMRAGARMQRRLDGIGALLLALMTALVAWYTGVGALSMKASGETSMLRGLPIWIAYAAMAPAFALTATVAAYTAFDSWFGRPE